MICHLVCLGDRHFQLQNWESLPSDKPVLSAFTRLFGQEWFFADIKKDFIQNFVRVRE